MTGQGAIVISFLIYLAFFSWLGWRRGGRREITVFAVALGAWILLQEQGNIVVNIANLGGAAMTFAQSGGFGGDTEQAFAALSSAPQLVTETTRQSFLFLVWVGIFVITYVLTNVAIEDKDSKRNGWAILFGTLNGLFFAAAFVPSLVALFGNETTLPTASEGMNFLSLLGSGLRLLGSAVASLWGVVESAGPLGLLLLLTAILLLTAMSIKGPAKRSNGD
jgi:hypothetical protein